MGLDEGDIQRYARHLVLPEIGVAGQERLKASSVLVIGAGGLGSAMLPYLAAAGIGRIGIVDDDSVDESNLQRQILYREDDQGRAKTEAAKAFLEARNSSATIETFNARLDTGNALEIVDGFDVVADGSDNLKTRLAVHDACFHSRIPLVSGSAQGMDGQLTTYKAFAGPPHPCMRCMSGGTDPGDADLPTCAQAGILGPVVGVIGALQAVEIIRVIAGMQPERSGLLQLFDATSLSFEELQFQRIPQCEGDCRYLPAIV